MSADGLLVPGVGAFRAVMDALRAVRGDELIDRRLAGGRPVLGICVGQQVLFERGLVLSRALIAVRREILAGRIERRTAGEIDAAPPRRRPGPHAAAVGGRVEHAAIGRAREQPKSEGDVAKIKSALEKSGAEEINNKSFE